MNPAIRICSGPERGAGTRGHTSGSPCAAARATNSHRERNGAKASSAICHGPVFSVRERTVRAIITNVVAPGSVPDADTIKAVRIKFLGAVLRLLRRLSSRPSIKFLAEQSRGKAPIRHSRISFFAPFHVPERSEGVFGNVRKSFGEVRNV